MKKIEPLSGNLNLDIQFKLFLKKKEIKLIKKIHSTQTNIKKYEKKLIYYKDLYKDLLCYLD